MNQPENIAIIGLGAMGGSLASRLLDLGPLPAGTMAGAKLA